MHKEINNNLRQGLSKLVNIKELSYSHDTIALKFENDGTMNDRYDNVVSKHTEELDRIISKYYDIIDCDCFDIDCTVFGEIWVYDYMVE